MNTRNASPLAACLKGQYKGPVEDSLDLTLSFVSILPQVAPKIEQLIVIERSVDLLTPLTTQLTYEGLIDQCFGINNCESGAIMMCTCQS